jgi:hypothetical protein
MGVGGNDAPKKCSVQTLMAMLAEHGKDAIHDDMSPDPESVCPQTFVLGRCIRCIFRPLDDTDVV